MESPPHNTAPRTSSSPIVSVVSPVYQAEGCIEELCHRLVTVLDELDVEYEIVLVDDRSADNSWKRIQSAAHNSQHIRGFRLSRNFGQHYAITAGLAQARGDWVVVMDCDLQERPEEIPRLLDLARQGHNVVLTRRQQRRASMSSRVGSFLFYKTLEFLTGDRYDSGIGALSVLSRNAVQAFLSFHEYHRYYLGVIRYLGFEPQIIDIDHAPRAAGRSSYSLLKRIELAVNGIASTSTRPLYISVVLGFVLSALALLYLFFVLIEVMYLGHGVPGWPSAIAATLLIGGVICSLLGVIGMYLARIYVEVRRRPLYIVAESTESETGSVE